jgi:hypothetical protein
MTEQPKPQNWHQIVGEGWEKFLTPVNISVFTELKVMSQPPRVDILLFRRDEPTWTVEQMARLPDGIRQSTASHILIELKYTESINQKAFSQAITYDYLYKESQELTDKDVQTFVLSAIKPQARTRKKWGYHRAKLKAVELYLIGLWQWFEAGEKMNIELTPENVMALGQKFGKTYLSTLSPETRKHFFSTVPIEERLADANPIEVMNLFKQTNKLSPPDILGQFSPEEIEAYLKQRKQQKNG